tara:strand:+ start:374 stop:832 length:459 start_codon:yes stop_codon:yes gene_type:complete
MKYVYELVNQEGVVEYVGITKHADNTRYKQHMVCSTRPFFQRYDLSIRFVSDLLPDKEARLKEKELKLSYGMVWTEGLGLYGGNAKATSKLSEWNKTGITAEQRSKGARTRVNNAIKKGNHPFAQKSTCNVCGKIGQKAGMVRHIRKCNNQL